MKIHSKRIYTADGLKEGVLEISDGKFVSFKENETDCDVDYGNNRIIPGIFDTHNHGTCGYNPCGSEGMSSEDIKKDIRGYLKGLASQGTVNIFPTVMGVQGCKEIYEVSKEVNDGAKILGIHSEGPWLNRVGEKGIKTGWPEVDPEVAKKMYEESNGLLRLVAIACEIPGTEEVIKYFLSKGVTMAAAHSDNNYEESCRGYDMGLSVSTHTGNVMTGLHHRDIGGLGAALTREDVTCEVICDGKHICNDMLKIYFKVKSLDKFMMVSDCTPLSGAQAGKYTAYGMEVNVTEDGFCLTDTGRLMGSTQPVLYDIYNLVENVGMDMETVVKMACLNPCIKYGFDSYKGSIEVGKDADFCVISDDYKALYTYSEGRCVYDREKEGVVFNTPYVEGMRL
ncbi:MAG: amidohydrolase family protein [Erysipelotrichaceae bacterium]|nr:amidohydrolase family protein [Erysipelotrichaceae bacterium]